MDPIPSEYPTAALTSVEALQPSKASHPSNTSQSRKTLHSSNFTSALPNEVLLEVFLCHVALWAASVFRDRTHGPARRLHGWMTIAWVCQRWRGAALGACGLWTTIHVTQPLEPLGTYLARSKNMPLTIISAPVEQLVIYLARLRNTPLTTISTPLEGTVAAWNLVLKHAHRVKTLTFNCSQFSSEALAALMHSGNFKFPHLTHLNWSRRGPPGMLQSFNDSDQAWPPLVFEPHGWSSGEVLELTLAPFVQSSQLFSRTLRELSLSNTKWGDSSPLAVWKTLFESLSTLLSLKELHVLESPPPFPRDLQQGIVTTARPLGISPVALPKLQLLEVSSSDEDGAQQAELLLAHISPPAGISVHVKLPHDHETSASEYTRLCSIIGAELLRGSAGSPPKVLRTLIIEAAPRTTPGGHTAVTVTGWHDVDTPLAELEGRPQAAQRPLPLFTITIARILKPISSTLAQQTPARDLWSTSDALRTHLPLGDLERLVIASSVNARNTDSIVMQMFMSFIPNEFPKSLPPYLAPQVAETLHAIRIVHDKILGQFLAWSEHARSLRVLSVTGPLVTGLVDGLALDAGDAGPLFPNLQELYLAGRSQYEMVHCAESLVGSLGKRCASPAKKLRNLVLDDPEVDDDAAAGLKDVVEELTCIRRSGNRKVLWRRTFVAGAELDS
ncbi:hypothetical protein PsYK624_033830 [Phanerochaete sordida]|uniref:F-box domain-containing protein n=1 Tax=Phanerochaete sordida TaxID=48140 RepID=A0A9P3G475_9APHY|nr:hypothetical protein PsYK624_033830 [Phanerochaete sordida]